jgi:hypothetical protein
VTAPSSQRLAEALTKAGFDKLARRAANDEFNDYLSPHAMPTHVLLDELARLQQTARKASQRFAAIQLRTRVINGEFDADKGEGEAWARSKEGRATLGRLVDDVHPDEKIEARYVKQMTELAKDLDRVFNGDMVDNPDATIRQMKPTGFVLLVYPFGDTGRVNYISNGADRRDIVVMFKELITRFEGAPEQEGHA